MTDTPDTPAEWQAAVDLAEFLLLLESCRLYGLIDGGPDVDVLRCEELLDQGRRLGYVPDDHAALIDRILPAFRTALDAFRG